MKVYNAIEYPQGSDAWWEIRRGVPTASCFDKILTAKTCKMSAQMDDYIAELIADTACQCPPYFTSRGRPVNAAMQNGIDSEPEARRWYEMECNLDVLEVGFCLTDDGRFGCSPDGLVGTDGGLELKCPLLKTQAGYLLKKELPPEYKAQVHGSLIVTGRKWWDFSSYSPGLPPLLIRVTPDKFTDALREALDVFWIRYQDSLAALKVLQ